MCNTRRFSDMCCDAWFNDMDAFQNMNSPVRSMPPYPSCAASSSSGLLARAGQKSHQLITRENGIESGCRQGRQGWSCGRKPIVLVLGYQHQEPRPLEVPPAAVRGTAINRVHPLGLSSLEKTGLSPGAARGGRDGHAAENRSC